MNKGSEAFVGGERDLHSYPLIVLSGFVTGWILWSNTLRWSLGWRLFRRDQHQCKGGGRSGIEPREMENQLNPAPGRLWSSGCVGLKWLDLCLATISLAIAKARVYLQAKLTPSSWLKPWQLTTGLQSLSLEGDMGQASLQLSQRYSQWPVWS